MSTPPLEVLLQVFGMTARVEEGPVLRLDGIPDELGLVVTDMGLEAGLRPISLSTVGAAGELIGLLRRRHGAPEYSDYLPGTWMPFDMSFWAILSWRWASAIWAVACIIMPTVRSACMLISMSRMTWEQLPYISWKDAWRSGMTSRLTSLVAQERPSCSTITRKAVRHRLASPEGGAGIS